MWQDGEIMLLVHCSDTVIAQVLILTDDGCDAVMILRDSIQW